MTNTNKAIQNNSMVDNLLQKFEPVIGPDFNKYKNHVLRVFLNCLLIDGEKYNEEKYAIASVFHDIGIWTDKTIDYLDPSIEQAKTYLTESGKPEWVDEIAGMIYWHHKLHRYHGIHEITIESFRKADWIDVSFGFFNFGYDRKKIKNNRTNSPNLGFHVFLVKKIFRNLFVNPLSPLPMFKR